MELQDRVERLEKQNRWLKLAVLCLTVVVCTVGIMGANANRVDPSRSRKFELVDGDGTVRAALTFDRKKPVLQFFTAKGDAGTQLSEEGLTLCDPRAKPIDEKKPGVLPSCIILSAHGRSLELLGGEGKKGRMDINLSSSDSVDRVAEIRVLKDLGKETLRIMTIRLDGDKPQIEVKNKEGKSLYSKSP